MLNGSEFNKPMTRFNKVLGGLNTQHKLNVTKFKLFKPKVNTSNGQRIFNPQNGKCIKLQSGLTEVKERSFINIPTIKQNPIKVSGKFKKISLRKEITGLSDSYTSTDNHNRTHAVSNASNTTNYKSRMDQVSCNKTLIERKSQSSLDNKSKKLNRSISLCNKENVIKILDETISGLLQLKTIIAEDDNNEEHSLINTKKKLKVKKLIKKNINEGISTLGNMIISSTTGETIRVGNKKIFNLMKKNETISKMTIDHEDTRKKEKIHNVNESLQMNGPNVKEQIEQFRKKRSVNASTIDNDTLFRTLTPPPVRNKTFKIDRFQINLAKKTPIERYKALNQTKNRNFYESITNFEFSEGECLN